MEHCLKTQANVGSGMGNNPSLPLKPCSALEGPSLASVGSSCVLRVGCDALSGRPLGRADGLRHHLVGDALPADQTGLCTVLLRGGTDRSFPLCRARRCYQLRRFSVVITAGERGGGLRAVRHAAVAVGVCMLPQTWSGWGLGNH